MSWVASALPAKTVSTKPPRISDTSAGTAPVCTTPGPTTQSSRRPSDRARRIPSATWRTTTVWGLSEDGLPAGGPKASLEAGPGTDTWIPDAPTTIGIPTVTSDRGTVRTRVPPAGPRTTTSPQSISGFSTSCHLPSRRTRVSRLVVA